MKKKLLVIIPGTLYPTRMALQVRIIDMIKELSSVHDVDIVSLVSSENEAKLTQNKLASICGKIFCLQKPNTNLVSKILLGSLRKILHFLLLMPEECFFVNLPLIKKKIYNIAIDGKYDIIQTEVWWQSSIAQKLPQTFKVVDTHDVLFLKRKLSLEYRSHRILSLYTRLWLNRYKKMELKYLNSADLIISISKNDEYEFKKYFPAKQHLLIPTGQDISELISFPREETNTIMFYGAMGSEQNQTAFWRLWDNIFPEVRRATNCNLIVVGSNPPTNIKRLGELEGVSVTGYIDDVRGIFSTVALMILPMELGGGFRSRTIEVMAMGIPIIGTENAISSVEITHGIESYIANTDQEMIKYAIHLLRNTQERRRMGSAAQQLVINKYSIESTYGILKEYYSAL